MSGAGGEPPRPTLPSGKPSRTWTGTTLALAHHRQHRRAVREKRGGNPNPSRGPGVTGSRRRTPRPRSPTLPELWLAGDEAEARNSVARPRSPAGSWRENGTRLRGPARLGEAGARPLPDPGLEHRDGSPGRTVRDCGLRRRRSDLSAAAVLLRGRGEGRVLASAGVPARARGRVSSRPVPGQRGP